jgi:hypothetical protein
MVAHVDGVAVGSDGRGQRLRGGGAGSRERGDPAVRRHQVRAAETRGGPGDVQVAVQAWCQVRGEPCWA